MKIIPKLLISLLVVSLVAVVFALFLLNWNIPFWRTFLFTVVVQYLFWYFYIELQQSNSLKVVKTVQHEIEAILEGNGTNAFCSYCKGTTFIPIIFGADNSYKCSHCEKENAVYVNVETAQKTQFLENAKFTSPESPSNEKPV